MSSQYSMVISGIGLCTSLGGYKDACAAYRAGLNRFASHENMSVMFAGDEEPEPLTIAAAATNFTGYQGVGRLIKMLLNAHKDLLSNLPHEIPKDGLVLLLATPDPEQREYNMEFTEEISRASRLQAYSDLIIGPLFSNIDSELNSLPMQMIFGDRIAFARILNKAADMLSKGEAKNCLLIVADSLVGDDILDDLLGRDQLKTSDNPVGFIPGEGAAMILLSASGQAQNGATPVGLSLAIDKTTFTGANGAGSEESDEDEGLEKSISPEERESWQGGKLIMLIRSLLQSSYENQWLPQVVTDLNGQENRAVEYGLLQVALKKHYPQARLLEEQIIALGFAETGTMMGPLALATVMASVQRGYARQREFLITLSEDNGKRAVIKLQF